MTRFTHERNTQVGATQLRVKIRHAGHRTEITNKLGSELANAQQLLQTTMAQLNRHELGASGKRFAARYFLVPDTGPSKEDLEKIKKIIEMTMNGLGSSKMTIKIGLMAGKNDDGSDDDVHGEVTQRPRSAPRTKHSYHNTVRDLDDGKKYVTGAIRMDQDTLLKGGRLAVVTLIHEATHKYAGTNDYCYFDDDSYTPDGTFDDKNEALKNADSYAWFIYKMGRKYRS